MGFAKRHLDIVERFGRFPHRNECLGRRYTGEEEEWLRDGFDVVLDKGTFDAISLMPRTDGHPHPCEVYRERVEKLIKPGDYLFVTSCNWTKEELISWLVTDDSGLRYHDEAKYPTFQFGGRTGQSVVTVVFKRDGLLFVLTFQLTS